jgi:imidazolonepropionase-like amidohydrolase
VTDAPFVPVREVMTVDPAFIDGMATVSDAVAVMRANEISSLVVGQQLTLSWSLGWAGVFDTVGGNPVLVRDGRIIEVGTAGTVAIPDGAEVIELEGRWLVPGFVNAHGHVNEAGDRSSIPEQLEIYAHYGVTPVLSLGDEGVHMREERWSPDLRRSRLFVSGPSLDPSSAVEAQSEVDRVAQMEVDWVKMHVTAAGRGLEQYPQVLRAAQEAGLPTAIHIEELEVAKDVLRAGATLLGHSVRDEPVDEELIDLMLERDVCLVPTFTRELSTFVYAERPDFFDDPFFLERSAPEGLEDFITPQRQAMANSPQSQYWRDALPLAKENMRVLHEAGVGIAMGTDSGPTGRFQGYFEHLEMEMMVDAGLSPRDVLVSSTGRAARCIGLDGTVGTITRDAWADFVVLDADPLEDIRNTREIHGIWIAGNRLR